MGCSFLKRVAEFASKTLQNDADVSEMRNQVNFFKINYTFTLEKTYTKTVKLNQILAIFVQFSEFYIKYSNFS